MNFDSSILNRYFTTEQFIDFLNEQVEVYNRPSFIENDPIVVPHQFIKKEDIEISGFFAAVFAWGQRITIINKTKELMERLDNSPHDFILNHSESDLQKLLGFKHRTFNETDLLFFVHRLKFIYQKFPSLEFAFLGEGKTLENGLLGFHKLFFDDEFAPRRTYKHVATPAIGSACKRLNMYLRWMVRQDDKGVDFGIWKQIKMSQLIIPLDVHVSRTARRMGLIKNKHDDFKAALELTDFCAGLCPEDPVKYDYAFFGISLMEKGVVRNPFG